MIYTIVKQDIRISPTTKKKKKNSFSYGYWARLILKSNPHNITTKPIRIGPIGYLSPQPNGHFGSPFEVDSSGNVHTVI